MAGRTKPDPAQPPEDEDDGVLRLGEEADEPKWGVFFRAGGRPYEGMLNPNGRLLLKYTTLLRKRGGNVATSWLLEEMLKPDAYAVLNDDPKISGEDVRKIVDKCTGLLFGVRPAAPKAKG